MGHRKKRKEDPRFLQGKGNYVDDVKLPGMLYMDIVRSPYAHAKINKIDASAALEMDGVLAVITGEDLKAAGDLHWMPTLMSDTQMVLPIDKVVYYAQEVCAVIATSRYIAADAIEQVFVDYEPLDAVVDPFEAMKDNVIVRDDKEEEDQPHLALGSGRQSGHRCRVQGCGHGRQREVLHSTHPRLVD